jgi:hypothetical protein
MQAKVPMPLCEIGERSPARFHRKLRTLTPFLVDRSPRRKPSIGRKIAQRNTLSFHGVTLSISLCFDNQIPLSLTKKPAESGGRVDQRELMW